MTKRTHHPIISRRRFLQACACTAAAGALGATGYVVANAPLPPPYSESSVFQTPVADKPTPDSPILLITNPQAQPSFGAYLGAILRAEGFVAFRMARLDAIDAALLAQFPLVLLAAGPLTAEAADLLRTYVLNSGHLIAFRPDPRLADLMGVRVLGGEVNDGLLSVADHPLAQGMTTQALQVHTPMAQYALAGAEPVAWIAHRDGSRTSYPAVTVTRAGKGIAALWAFDLPRNIALIRQGNPAAANQERDGMEGVRTVDLFVDWIDLDRIEIPQADEQQRLLATMVQALAGEAPLPRLWYLPAGASAVLVTTGDAHGLLASHINAALEVVHRHNGALSIYYAPPPMSNRSRTLRRVRWWASELPVAGAVFTDNSGYPTPKDVARWRDSGHGFGLHPYVEQGVSKGYHEYWNTFIKLGYGPAAPTVRTHRVLWSGWVETARVQAQYGLRMSLDHYHSGPLVRRADGRWVHGYLTGSGLPMPFVDEQGNLLRVYQQHTHIVDEHLMPVFDTGYEMGADANEAAAIACQQIDIAVKRYPSALGLQCHIDPFSFGEDKAEAASAWFSRVLEYAASHSVLIVSAEQWLAFTEMRNHTEMRNLTWNEAEGMLTFETVVGTESPYALALLLPLEHHQRTLRQVTIDGVLANAEQKRAGGVAYGAVALAAGRRQVRAYYR
ncbi:MAG: twin-arginine translocation signal domain-containing protein [Roseiflexaceae bacterium]|nr:twin-arginine translocation signal domain-containing protein [Roseiflexaceae bacterium]